MDAAGGDREPGARAQPRVRSKIVAPRDVWPAYLDEIAPGAAPLVLALDTSSRFGGVALCSGPELLGEETWRADGSQTVETVPVVRRLCERSGVQVAELAAITVATGPGSFTGLRVGASLAKGLAAALNIDVAGVPTLDVTAYQHRVVRGTIVAIVSAGRGQLYSGTYRSTARGVSRVGDFAVLSPGELAGAVAALGTAYVCGEVEPALARALHGIPGVHLASPAATVRRPAFLAELGYWQLRHDGPSDRAALQPLYLRRA